MYAANSKATTKNFKVECWAEDRLTAGILNLWVATPHKPLFSKAIYIMILEKWQTHSYKVAMRTVLWLGGVTAT